MITIIRLDGPSHPTREEMALAARSGRGVRIITGAEEFELGDHLLDSPLEGRPFRFGVFDCFEAIRSWFWQRRSVYLPPFPRSLDWSWEGGNAYFDHYAARGFAEIPAGDQQEGDVILGRFGMMPWYNHALVDNGDGRLYHHHSGASGYLPAACLKRMDHRRFRLWATA